MNVVLQILTLFGSLGMFLYGMSLMSGGLQKMAGAKLRSFMSKMTSSKLKCVLSGILVTAMVQSSTATTLMLVSFVNAGLLSLANAIGVIMGANIGTTVTAWIFALSFGGSSFSIGTIAVPLMFFAFICISLKKKYENFGEFLMGFALLFLGLSTLRETSTVLLDNEPVRLFLSGLTGGGGWSILLFMIVGAMMTLMLQSSAATMAITMVLVANGYIPFHIAAAMVLGENIGTTITSNIAASVANVSAKRTARAHMLFNVFGVIWASILFRPFLRLIGRIVSGVFGFPDPVEVSFTGSDPATKEALVASLPFVVATLHTLFNIINTLILIWFIPQIERIVTFMVPSPKGEEEVFRLKYIHLGTVNTAELSLKESQQEIIHFGRICLKGLGHIRNAINADSEESFKKRRDMLIKYEEITDNIEYEIANYLGEVTKNELSSSALARVKGSYRIIGEMESLGDSGEAIGRMLQRTYDHKRRFTGPMLEKLNVMIDKLEVAYNAMLVNLAIPVHEITDIRNATDAEIAINQYRDALREEHLNNIENADYPYDTGVFYIDLVNELEAMGDFVINISESLMDEKEA
ncbi:MAG: Na/Pi cotransporter family protein [Bacteroidales bacterium]|nr:Na/Pi cotransporter family protein [Bacteroidales bacterium]